MKLSSVLVPNHIVLDLSARTLRDALPELLERVASHHLRLPVPRILDALLKREDMAPTVTSKGIAVPHARISELRDFYVVLGRTATPLDDCDAAGQPVDLLFLTVCNDQKNTLMLQTLAAVGVLSHDEALLARIREARSRDEVWHAIDKSGIAIKTGLYAHDIMRPAKMVASEGMLLGELLDRCSAAGVHYAPVCDERGRLVGSVTSREIVDAGFPEYMSGLRDISFLNDSESFLEFFQREATTRVAAIMNRRPLIVQAGDPLIQVVFRMHKQGERFAFVVDDERCVGVVDRDDICERILRP